MDCNLFGGYVDVARFWARVEKTETCWLWRGGIRDIRTPYGFVAVMVESARGRAVRTESAHRVSWELANGRPIPHGLYVLHSCDTPRCVNPAHLSVGTHGQNMVEKMARGRQARGPMSQRRFNPVVAERAPGRVRIRVRRLTDEQVRTIRTTYATGDITSADLARQYGVSNPMMLTILTGKTYRGAGGPIIERARKMQGANAPWARFTEQQVLDIRRRYATDTITMDALGAEYGTKNQTISSIIRGKSWAHVSGPKNMVVRPRHRKLTDDQVREIRASRAAGETCIAIAVRLGVSHATVSLVSRGKHHADVV